MQSFLNINNNQGCLIIYIFKQNNKIIIQQMMIMIIVIQMMNNQMKEAKVMFIEIIFTEIKADVQEAEVVVEVQAEEEVEVQAEAEVEVQAEAEVEVQVQAEVVAQAVAEVEAQAELEEQAEVEALAEVLGVEIVLQKETQKDQIIMKESKMLTLALKVKWLMSINILKIKGIQVIVIIIKVIMNLMSKKQLMCLRILINTNKIMIMDNKLIRKNYQEKFKNRKRKAQRRNKVNKILGSKNSSKKLIITNLTRSNTQIY
ncbi:transmembrane protein, putative (macronuclear) [Tetrahymena thermophila SB210]|uniref:Transmembrane protein, putative n=1 Tax=Tetrahymena thermophila (strain SB210) TaxID=312017 RepID=Q231E6_TETTS|nr:transmembrane protein, putative [Tetrahymena thermophila SB210]EAR91093.2 transmembrane protein, putative [Tetrahymena thermophila SB210]|eukprot:XP_001011338.2 transmembrane protein, putative [Tetrahymena thermophila SB210]